MFVCFCGRGCRFVDFMYMLFAWGCCIRGSRAWDFFVDRTRLWTSAGIVGFTVFAGMWLEVRVSKHMVAIPSRSHPVLSMKSEQIHRKVELNAAPD